MDYKIFIFIIISLLLLILMVLWYRNYVYQYCRNDMKCLKNKLIFSLNKLNEINNLHNTPKEEEQEIEGFFGGLGGWFSGSSPSAVPALPVSPGSFQNENLNTLERKINDKMTLSNKFPPTELNGNSDDFKDASNDSILNKPISLIASKALALKAVTSKQDTPPVTSKQDTPPVTSKQDTQPVTSKQDTAPVAAVTPNMQSLLGTCQFYNDKCPDKYFELGNFGIEGIMGNSTLKCGNVQNSKPAKAIAQIKNNTVYEIHVVDKGQGYNPSEPPKITIEGGKGHGCVAQSIVDDDGYLKVIKIINPGYNYTETPNIIIEANKTNISCHLCCKQ
jgi:hypothetical protein